MRYWYIDSENVGAKAWCRFIHLLGKQDVIVVIRTVMSHDINIKYLTNLVNCKCKVEVVNACNGTCNALDFVLVAELTKHAMSARKSQHIIVSADKGYTPVILWLKQQGIASWQVSGINQVVINKLDNTDFSKLTDTEIALLKSNDASVSVANNEETQIKAI